MERRAADRGARHRHALAGPSRCRAGRRARGRVVDLKRLAGLVSEGGLRQAISDLEALRADSPVISVGAIHVLKNELAPIGSEPPMRRLLFERTFTLPGRRSRSRQIGSAFAEWSRGGGGERFRDECDHAFWQRMVPVISAEFGDLAEPFMNTINEVIINYAEHSFRPWAARRRITAQIFLTEDRLAYGIVRPHGSRQRVFDPLQFKEKKAETLRDLKRGWGHTLLMRRALFISFDHSEKYRGMMVVVGSGAAQ